VYRKRYERRRSPKLELYIRKTKSTFYGTLVSVPLPKFCIKKLSSRKISCEIGQSAAELWPKTTWILKIFIFGYLAVIGLCVFGGRGQGRGWRTRTLCIRRTLCRHVTIGTPIAIFAVFTVFWLFLTIGTVGTVLIDLWRFVHQWSTRSPAGAGIANRPLVFLGFF